MLYCSAISICTLTANPLLVKYSHYCIFSLLFLLVAVAALQLNGCLPCPSVEGMRVEETMDTLKGSYKV